MEVVGSSNDIGSCISNCMVIYTRRLSTVYAMGFLFGLMGRVSGAHVDIKTQTCLQVSTT
jgi:hypothetical protein